MLAIKDTSVVPPENWTYRVEATGTTITTKGYDQLYPQIVQHCRSNNVAVPSQQDVIDTMCREIHISCYESETRVPLVNKFSLGVPMPRPTACCGQARLPK